MIELVQFRHSPYNEKVRWALDAKRVAHTRRSVLPGPHMGIVRRLTGRTSTPVLIHDGQAMDQSASILAWLESHYPQPALLPADPAQRAQALRIEAWFDDQITPRIRRTVLDVLLREPGSFARVFGDGRPRWQQLAYALIVPLAAPLVRKGNGISGPASVQDGHRAIQEALDFVAGRSAAGDHLVGTTLSVADITVAATLATIVHPEHSPMACPQSVGPLFRQLMDRYADHAGAAWVRRIYARHRGAVADFDGPSA